MKHTHIAPPKKYIKKILILHTICKPNINQSILVLFSAICTNAIPIIYINITKINKAKKYSKYLARCIKKDTCNIFVCV